MSERGESHQPAALAGFRLGAHCGLAPDLAREVGKVPSSEVVVLFDHLVGQRKRHRAAR